MQRVPACFAQLDAAAVSRLGAPPLEEQSDPGLPDGRTDGVGGRRRREEETGGENLLAQL